MEYIIYRISHKTLEGLDYVGSTTDFERRKAHHKSCCLNTNLDQCNLKIYQLIRANGGWDQFDMIVIKTMVCCKQEALIEEEKYRIELNATLNSNYAIESKEHVRKKHLQTEKKRYEQNKEQILKKRKEFYQENWDQIRKQKAEEYQRNKEQILKQQAEYRQQNREKLTEKFDCACGGKYTYESKSKHSKTKRHQDYLANLSKN